MAHMGSGRQMTQAPDYRDAMQRPANPAHGSPVDVKIPEGGSVHVRKIANGVVASIHDAQYNTTEVHAPSAGHLRMK